MIEALSHHIAYMTAAVASENHNLSRAHLPIGGPLALQYGSGR